MLLLSTLRRKGTGNSFVPDNVVASALAPAQAYVNFWESYRTNCDFGQTIKAAYCGITSINLHELFGLYPFYGGGFFLDLSYNKLDVAGVEAALNWIVSGSSTYCQVNVCGPEMGEPTPQYPFVKASISLDCSKLDGTEKIYGYTGQYMLYEIVIDAGNPLSSTYWSFTPSLCIGILDSPTPADIATQVSAVLNAAGFNTSVFGSVVSGWEFGSDHMGVAAYTDFPISNVNSSASITIDRAGGDTILHSAILSIVNAGGTVTFNFNGSIYTRSP